jgi:hypothetical protein
MGDGLDLRRFLVLDQQAATKRLEPMSRLEQEDASVGYVADRESCSW